MISWCMFLPFCFYVGIVLVFFVLFLFCFCLVFLFCFQSVENIVFSLQFDFYYCVLCWFKGSLFFMFYAFVIDFCFPSVFVCSLNNEVALFCVCVVCFLFCSKTKWFYRLHLVVLFLVWLFCAQFFIPQIKQKQTQQKHKDKQKCRKRGQIQNSVSAVVFTDSVPVFFFWGGGLLKMQLFAENTIK